MNEVTTHSFSELNLNLRSIMINDDPWFVAKDACDALEIANVTQAVERLDEDERSMLNIGRQGEVNIINESGLYSLILSSRKPTAKRFKKWVTSEVIPSIRKTGGYQSPKPIPTFDPFDREMTLFKVVNETLRPSDASKIRMLGIACDNHGVSKAMLPTYSDNEGDTAAATTLLKEAGTSMSTVTFNRLMMWAGLLEKRTRPSTKAPAKVKEFKCLSEAGLVWGKNMTSPQNERETQPHYFRAKFHQLLTLLEI